MLYHCHLQTSNPLLVVFNPSSKTFVDIRENSQDLVVSFAETRHPFLERISQPVYDYAMTKRKKAPWYSEEAGFFGEGYLREYVAFTNAQPTKRDIAFVTKVLHLRKGMRILENDKEDQKVLHAIAKALKPGGKFLINVRSPNQLMKTYTERDWAELSDGSLVLTERHFNTTLGRNEERRIRLQKNGKREEYIILCRMYTIPELMRMGKEAGLRFLKAYGDGEDPHTIDSKRMMLIFKKVTLHTL